MNADSMLAHGTMVEQWRRFIANVPLCAEVRPVILESWQRSQRAGVRPDDEALLPPRVSTAELNRRLEAAKEFMQIARPHLQWLSASLSGVAHVAYITDRDGIVLYSSGDPTLQEQFGLAPGYDWSENSMGTNGAGTALSSDRPAAVIGAEHYRAAFHDCTCMAAPVHLDGEVIGAIDVSTSAGDATPDRLMLVSHIAYVIDRELRDREAVKRESAQRVVAAALRVDIVERKRTEEALRERTLRLNFLSESASALLAADRPTAFLNRIYGQLATLLGLELYIHYGVAPAGTHLELIACRGLSEEQRHDVARLEFGAQVCGAVAASREAWIVEDVQARVDEGTALIRSLGITRYVCHPLISRGALVGTLSFGACSGTRFDETSLALIRTVCDQVATAIEREGAEQALRDADRRKDEFLATLAHELRNPLAPIRNAVQFMRLKGAPDPRMQHARDVIDRQTKHLSRLVDDLLDVSRITSGRIELQREQVSVTTVVANALEASRPQLDRAGHALMVRGPEEPVYVEADPTRLSQVLANLLNNAAKYTPPGGRIELTVARTAEQAVVRISDTGIGIPKEMLNRVFDMFTQVDSSIERTHGGLGIGLTLAQQLAQLHGGRIEAKSEGAGRGSEFTVYLPLSRGGARAIQACSRHEPSVGTTRRRVLIVDDNVDAAQCFHVLLETLGHEVRSAHDGLDALEAAERFRPEIVLLDIGMPRLNGYEVARRIRQEPWGRRILLLAVTGWGQEDDKERARAAGFDYHLTKPVDPERVENLLTSWASRTPPQSDLDPVCVN